MSMTNGAGRPVDPAAPLVHYHPMPHPLMLTPTGEGTLANAEAFSLTTTWALVTCQECLGRTDG